MFVDVHSHVVPSGDDGAPSVEAGLELCRMAAHRGTSVLYATPHVWPHLPLSADREAQVRAAYVAMAEDARAFGLDLRLGFELTPTRALLEEDLRRYRLGDLAAVLVEVPFAGPAGIVEQLAEHAEASGLVPVLAHPERGEAPQSRPDLVAGWRERGWLVQVNGSSLLGSHGDAASALGWRLVESGEIDLIASDGHRATRPPALDTAYEAVRARVGNERAGALFTGRRLYERGERGGGMGESRRAPPPAAHLTSPDPRAR